MTNTNLSIIFPAYNEAARIRPALLKTVDYLATWRLPFDFRAEIIVILNGCTDNTREIVTETYLEIARKPYHDITLRLDNSRPGKGAAIRRGLNISRGRYILVTDVDLSTPLEEMPRLLQSAAANQCIVIGSRRMPGATVKGREGIRAAAAWVFSYFFTRPLVPGIKDTQCGYKVFTQAAARKIAPLATLDGFAIDVELLHIARRLGIGIVEIPVKWTHDKNSTVRVLRDSARMARDIFIIGRNSLTGCYTE
jgi:dolichyl-phosphate beta-glucosyltransferase